ncbi:hypothetical protein N9Q69_01345 [bacterium]|nr:hypothetical protein [bacterium]
MNIYALKGHKVKLSKNGFNMGFEVDKDEAKSFLSHGIIYTVDCTNVSNSSSVVILHEFPNKTFNTVHFEDVSFQSEDEKIKHPDWLYNRYRLLRRKHLKKLNIRLIAIKLGYDQRKMFQKISQWYYHQYSDTIDAELKEFEKSTLEFLKEAKADTSSEFSKEAEANMRNFIQLCQSKKS